MVSSRFIYLDEYEYGKEVKNMEWKDHLGLRAVSPTSFFVRYRSILGNRHLMIVPRFIIVIIIICMQLCTRFIPTSESEINVFYG